MLLMAGRVDRSQNQLICPAMRESEAQPASIAAGNPLMPGKSGGGLMALGAVVLAGCLAVLAVLSFDTTEPLMLTLMAFLATLGVFFLFGLAAGHIRIAERKTDGEVVAALAKGFSDGLCVTTLEGRRLYANPAFDTLVAPAKFSHVSALETLFAGEPQAAEALFRLARAAGRNESRTEEVRLRTVVAGQRHSRWFRLGVTPVNTPLGLDETGPVVLWRITDITDERRREVETLRSLEATLGHYEAMPIGLMVTDENAGIEYINDALAQWLGLSAGALVRGLKLTDIVSGDGAVLLRAMARDACETAQRIDLDLVREDGRTWPASLIVVPRAQSGKAEGFSAVIIERVAEEETPSNTRPAEVRFTRFFQSAPFGIATVNAEGKIASSNAAFARLLHDGKISQSEAAIDVLTRGVDADKRAAVEAALREALSGKANIQPVEITVGEAHEFTRRVFFSTASRGSGAESAVLYVIDATELKALELKFAQSQKMEAVGQLAGGIAHDFNNVLTAIIGFSDLLLQTHRPSDPPYRNIINIKSSAERAAELVSQLLAFSRRQTLQPEVLQLSETLTDTSMMLNRTLGEKVELRILPGRDLWFVKADRSRLESVIVNLSVNARDAMPEGGQLTIRTRNVSERESQKLDTIGVPVGEYVMIEVEDTGHGMPQEVQEKIFEPFFTTKSVGKGTGLGLAQVYGIVKQTGGFIFVDSTIGKGTTFRIYLPRHEVDVEAVAEAAKVKAAKKERHRDLTGAGRVLLVEDEDAVRSFAIEALKRQGYEVLEATTGAEALEVMDETDQPVDLVISDVIMPEMDGPSMYKVMRQTNPDLKIIFMSGYPDDAFKNSLDPDAKFAFLQKPFSLAQLAAKVKEELAQ